METLQKLTRRQLDALQVIQEIESPERGARLGDIASRLKITSPSTLTHLTALEKLNLVERYRGKTRLTPTGAGCLLEYQRHHRIVERMFAKVGYPSDRICDAAREVDLSIDHATVERICQAEGHPDVCPHGEPIPSCPEKKQGRN